MNIEIEELIKDIKNHERVLLKYVGSRWYSQSKNALDVKKAKLKDLELKELSDNESK